MKGKSCSIHVVCPIFVTNVSCNVPAITFADGRTTNAAVSHSQTKHVRHLEAPCSAGRNMCVSALFRPHAPKLCRDGSVCQGEALVRGVELAERVGTDGGTEGRRELGETGYQSLAAGCVVSRFLKARHMTREKCAPACSGRSRSSCAAGRQTSRHKRATSALNIHPFFFAFCPLLPQKLS